jgi:hypothetical protein
MDKNVLHPVDKALRIIIGIALLSLIFLIDSPARWLGLIGIVPILTVVFGWCPAYAMLAACGCKPKFTE